MSDTLSDLVTDPVRQSAVERLRSAAVDGVPCVPVRDLIGANDIAAAYVVQKRLTDLRLASGSGSSAARSGLRRRVAKFV